MGLADQTCGFRLLPLGYLGPHTLLQLAGLELEDPQVYRPTLCAARLRATQKAPTIVTKVLRTPSQTARGPNFLRGGKGLTQGNSPKGQHSDFQTDSQTTWGPLHLVPCELWASAMAPAQHTLREVKEPCSEMFFPHLFDGV